MGNKTKHTQSVVGRSNSPGRLPRWEEKYIRGTRGTSVEHKANNNDDRRLGYGIRYASLFPGALGSETKFIPENPKP
jgi:hypothetical protein